MWETVPASHSGALESGIEDTAAISEVIGDWSYCSPRKLDEKQLQ